MKDFFKAYKLYFRTAYSPGLAVFGIFILMFNALTILLLGYSYKYGDNSYKGIETAMYGIPAFLHLYIIFLFQRFNRITQNKFFLSLKNAKLFYTITPMAVIGSILLIYDILMFVISLVLFDGEYAGDLLIVFASCTVMNTIAHITQEMPKLSVLCGIAYSVSFVFTLPVISMTMGYERGFGLPLGIDILISLGIYIVGGALIIGIMNLWWYKSGRNLKFKEKQKSILGIEF